ncbi:transcriptional regulator, partial [Bacillus thuringiensis]|nr:transcriptional regulator [Bacillus thuringiensis]
MLFLVFRKKEDTNISPAYIFSCLIREKIWRNHMESNILIVDDDKEIRNLISVY